MAGKRITVEDLWKLDRPTQPALSPDGAQACVSVASFDMKENTQRSTLWLLSAFGGEPRQLTQCGEKDGEPRWSPDGRWIAFIAKRAGVGTEKGDEEPQVYLIAPDGGEARRLTEMPTGAFGIRGFPIRAAIAFLSWVWPDTKGLEKLAEALQGIQGGQGQGARGRAFGLPLLGPLALRRARAAYPHGGCRKRQDPRLFAGTRYELVGADPSNKFYDISPDGREIAFSFDPAKEKRFDHENRSRRARPARRASSAASPRRRSSRTISRAIRPTAAGSRSLCQDLKQSSMAAARLALFERKSRRLAGGLVALGSQPQCAARVERRLRERPVHAEDDARLNLFGWKLGAKRARCRRARAEPWASSTQPPAAIVHSCAIP